MLSTLVHIALFVALATRHVASGMSIDTPTLTQCQNATISYSGGQGSYGLYVVPSSDPCADSVVDIPEQTGTSYQWMVNIPAGSQVELLVEDSTGDEAWSGTIMVQNSSDASCVDPKAAKVLNADKSVSSSGVSPSGSSSAGALPTASTTFALSAVAGSGYATGVAQSVTPVSPSSPANAAGGGGAKASPSSGSIPSAALPAGSLIGVAAFLLTVSHM